MINELRRRAPDVSTPTTGTAAAAYYYVACTSNRGKGAGGFPTSQGVPVASLETPPVPTGGAGTERTPQTSRSRTAIAFDG